MTKEYFQKFQEQAKKLCEDYSTTTAESDTPIMYWFTPQQLKQYTEYCLKQITKNK